jgi:purine-binding chemotaxis protein CheW
MEPEVQMNNNNRLNREEEQIEADFNMQKVLWFALGYEEYGINVEHVQTVIDMAVLTPVPNTPRFCRGVINLRGNLVPVVDLKEMFQMQGAGAPVQNEMMVILDIEGMRVGMLVDRVNEVLEIDFSRLQPPPASVSGFGAEYIIGMFKLTTQILIVVDIEKVISIAREMISKYS